MTRRRYLSPWHSIETEHNQQRAMEAEAARELAPEHELFGKQLIAVARRYDQDDVLFELIEPGRYRFAVVHLTWSGRPEGAKWPTFTIYESYEAFAQQRMAPDSDEWY